MSHRTRVRGEQSSAGGPPAERPPHASHPLFLLDYDGTLAPMTQDPDLAVPHPRVAGLLRELAQRFPVFIITGRRVTDVARLLPVAGVRVVGVHGVEEGVLDGRGGAQGVASRLKPSEAASIREVARGLPRIAGVRAEDKGSAVALHYRGVEDEEHVRKSLREWAERLPAALRVVWGKKVVEVRPDGYDKGLAALTLAREHQGLQPVMLGDDTTDEDAFEKLAGEERLDAITIRVGGGETGAGYRLPDIDAAVEYLEGYLGSD